jgi:hypothetical protein
MGGPPTAGKVAPWSPQVQTGKAGQGCGWRKRIQTFSEPAPRPADRKIAPLDQPIAGWRRAFRAAVDQRRLGADFP